MLEDNFEICLKLSGKIYEPIPPQNEDGWEILKIANFCNQNNECVIENFTCAAYGKNDEIIITFRGTHVPKDFLSDFELAIGKIPPSTSKDARNFYNAVIAQYQNSKIYFTGHSLGGAYAQLLGAQLIKEGIICKTITFNAPGMAFAIDEMGCSDVIKYSNIHNYVIMNDYVGNFKTHIGDICYIQPVPIEKNPLLTTTGDPFMDTHNSILAYNQDYFGQIYPKPKSFEKEEALALWYYDVNNTLPNLPIIIGINAKALKKAIEIIKKEVTPLLHHFHYKILGRNYDLS